MNKRLYEGDDCPKCGEGFLEFPHAPDCSCHIDRPCKNCVNSLGHARNVNMSMNMKDRVCDGCGGPLSPIATIDNSGNQTHWQGCVSCERYTEGVPLRVFKVARRIVEEQLIVPYKHIKPGDEDYLVGQTAGVANILARIEELLSDFS